ncbi:MAG: SDR family oxidoreductase [Actinomycetota bacterium]
MTTDESAVPDYLDLLRLDGRRIVVAGAGQGMGRQTAHALAQAGARVICVDVEPDRAESVADEIDATAWVGDVTTRDGAQRLADDAHASFGGVDGLVDIIGMARWAGILELDDDNWDWSLSTNLRHAYLLTQTLGRLMVDDGGGTMVFIASVSGLNAAPNHAAYGAAKAGLMGWVQSVAVELGPQGVRANAIAPGSIRTPRIEAQFSDTQRAANIENAPVRRMGETSDIAGAALFLTSDLSGYVSGRTLVVDGGVDAKFPFAMM